MSVQSAATSPVFGIILVGGALSGALVRDIRLANELHRRGYKVHVWWAVARTRKTALHPDIPQHWFFGGLRFAAGHRLPALGHAVFDFAGRTLNTVFTDRARGHFLQQRPHVLSRTMEPIMHRLCDGVDRDAALVARLAKQIEATGVTHVLPMLEMLCPWVEAARRLHPARCGGVKYLVTFQGYELYSMYARSIGREAELYQRLVEAVDRSDYPAIAVSADYVERVAEEVGVSRARLVAIPPGVPTVPASERMNEATAKSLVKERFEGFDPGLPLITYLGRQDAEKGIDIFLYACAMLRREGHRFQVAICGPTLWGDEYAGVCKRIAQELRLPIHWRRFVPDDVRSALFTISRAIVYPSIHREPFGMVPVEAVARGVPAVVPDYGGVAQTIEADGAVAGLRFAVWDSGSLAQSLTRLLTDDELHGRLAAAGPRVADYYSVERLGDRMLQHLGLAH